MLILLVAEIFASGDSSDKVATEWYHKYRDDDIAATTELVNCILSSAGCDHQVTDDDIRDPDNCQNRLADLQNVYAEVSLFPASPHLPLLLTRFRLKGGHIGLSSRLQGQVRAAVPRLAYRFLPKPCHDYA